jgi:hypothetical protein
MPSIGAGGAKLETKTTFPLQFPIFNFHLMFRPHDLIQSTLKYYRNSQIYQSCPSTISLLTFERNSSRREKGKERKEVLFVELKE